MSTKIIELFLYSNVFVRYECLFMGAQWLFFGSQPLYFGGNLSLELPFLADLNGVSSYQLRILKVSVSYDCIIKYV